MSIIKTIASKIYEFAFSEKERQDAAMNGLSVEQRASIAIGYLKREAPQHERGSPAYNRIHQSVEDFLLLHHRATSLSQLCRSFVRRSSNDTYFQTVALGNLVRSGFDQADGEKQNGGEAAKLLEAIRGEIELARAEKSHIKRRSIIRNGLKREVPGFSADQIALAIELVIAIDKQ